MRVGCSLLSQAGSEKSLSLQLAGTAYIYFPIWSFQPLFEQAMPQLPNCPECNGEFTYEDGPLLVCPTCAHEWSSAEPTADDDDVTLDANGNALTDGDTVVVVKDLKFKGGVVKGGTKVKNIRIVEGDHNIDCKIDGIGAMALKSEFVKRA